MNYFSSRIMFSFRALLQSLLVIALASCSGGGGDDGGGAGNRTSNGIRVLHAAVDTTPFQVTGQATPNEILTVTKFAKPVDDITLPGGETALRIVPSLAEGSTLLVTPLPTDGERQTVLIHGTSDAGLHSSVFLDEAGEIPTGKSAIRVIHGVRASSSVTLQVDLPAQEAAASEGNPSSYLMVDSGIRHLVVTASGTGGPIATIDAELISRRTYSLLVAGEIGYFATSALFED